MDCEVCGRQIYGRGRSIIIDGAKLMVCFDCAQLATSTSQTYRELTSAEKKAPSSPRIPQRRTVTSGTTAVYEDFELMDNYSSSIRKAREGRGWTHEELSRQIGEKISLLQKLETGKMVPDREVAKKLEHTLKIKLFKPAPKISIEKEFIQKPSKLTLGDLISIQRKKSAPAEE